jgi:glucose dehydrogenase
VPVLQSSAMRVEYASKQGRVIVRKMWLLATVVALWPAPGTTQTADELINDGKNADNVITQSMGYDRKSYSPLKQIDKSNIKRLVPIWSTSLMNDSGELSAPVIYNGVMYAINGKWTFAIDVETGARRSSSSRGRCACRSLAPSLGARRRSTTASFFACRWTII